MQVKPRLSGVKDKYYIHSITGSKCRSKREVLQYIGNGEIACRRRSVESKAIAQGTPSESMLTKRMSGSNVVSVAQVGTSPPWLSSDWVMQVKERQSGIRDKYYIHSITGHKCRSKKEVLGYLGNGETACRTSVGSKGIAQGTQSESAITKRTSGSNAVAIAQVEMLPPWLPSGWAVQVKERQSGLRDKYYIDPVSGYKFRSKLEVGRYLEKGELPKKFRMKRGVNDTGSTGQKVQIQRLGCSSTRRCLFTRQSSEDCKMEFSDWIQEPTMTKEETPSNMQALDKNGLGCCSESGLALIPLETEDSKNMQENIVHTRAKYVVPLSVVSPQNQLEHKSWGKHGKRKSKFREPKPQNRKPLGLGCKNSRRLAGLEPELAPEMRKTKRVVAKESRAAVVTEKSDTGFCTEAQPNEPVARELGDQVAETEHMRKLEEYQIRFREPLLDPCVSFASRTLTDAVTGENSLIESQLLLQHVGPVSNQNTDCLKMPELNGRVEWSWN